MSDHPFLDELVEELKQPIEDVDSAAMSTGTVDVIVCSRCAASDPPDSLDDWLKLRLVEERDGIVTQWRCPVCREIVATLWDCGEIELGV